MLVYETVKDWAGFLFGTADSVERVRTAARTPLHHLPSRYGRYKALGLRLVVLAWDLVLAVICSCLELVVITYRIILMVGKVKGMLKDTKVEEDNVPDLIRASGYQVETHPVTTEDGYILELHRIPSTGKPVFLMHGMLCSSYCWVTSETNSLAFILADEGYDVWMGNFRGTKYSRKHQHLDPDKDMEFWRFTLHELGTMDIAAMLSSVINISKKSSLSFIGHSMGTTSFLILASTKPQLVKKVNLAILMAPVVEPHNMSNLVWYLSPLEKVVKWVMESVGILEILPASLLIEKLTWDHIGHLCLKLQLRGSPILSKEDSKMLNRICHHARTSKTSFYTVLHYAQNITNKYFHAYDWYDAAENLRRYGCEEPPTYDLSKVSVPSALFWSQKDSLSSKEDMERIVCELPNLVSCKEVDIGHLDYLWGANVKGDLYYDLLDILATHTTRTHTTPRTTPLQTSRKHQALTRSGGSSSSISV